MKCVKCGGPKEDELYHLCMECHAEEILLAIEEMGYEPPDSEFTTKDEGVDE